MSHKNFGFHETKMAKLFSRRKNPPSVIHRYDISEQIRTRILAVFKDHCYEPYGGFEKLLSAVGDVLFKQYGGLSRSSYVAARRSDHPVIEHFYSVDTDYAIDFIEACFQQNVYNGGQKGVDEINEIFLETGIGFELTPFVEHHVEKEGALFGRIRKGTYIEYEYPRVVPRDNQLVHEEVISPAFHLLTDYRLRVANSEILKAHSALRSKDFESAITLSASAFESLLKTICDIKGWSYDPHHDTCSKLVKICKDNNLFPPFYVPLFESVGSIRNKLSNAHGRGPTLSFPALLEHAEHMIHITSSHMLFLMKLAGLG
jgi:hypothetical protein